MKNIIEAIYLEASSRWDGEFMSLEDSVKDMAIRRYLYANRQQLAEIFPVCCDGAEMLLLKSLYSDVPRFRRVFQACATFQPRDEVFQSEAFREGDEDRLEEAYTMRDGVALAEFWGDIIYRYCEDALRELCAEWFDEVEREQLASLMVDWQITERKEAFL